MIVGFREFVYDKYFKTLKGLAERLLEAFAMSLKLQPSHFNSMVKKPVVTLRFNHYLMLPAKVDEEQISCGIHTDNDAFTILAQDDTGGLQTRLADGRFVPVPFIPNTFVINTGDILERWSNGKYKASPHRVIAPPGKERYSVGWFLIGDYGAIIEPSVKDEIPKYEPITAGDCFESVEIPAHVYTQDI